MHNALIGNALPPLFHRFSSEPKTAQKLERGHFLASKRQARNASPAKSRTATTPWRGSIQGNPAKSDLIEVDSLGPRVSLRSGLAPCLPPAPIPKGSEDEDDGRR